MRHLLVACLLLAACGPGATRVHTVATRGPERRYSPFRDYPDPAPTTTSSTTTTAAPTTTTEPPRPTVTAASRGSARTEPNWEALRECESEGDYSTNTGNGYYGAYQFSAGTWQGLGYEGSPSDAPPSTQDEAARRLYEARGASPWPVCGRLL